MRMAGPGCVVTTTTLLLLLLLFAENVLWDMYGDIFLSSHGNVIPVVASSTITAVLVGGTKNILQVFLEQLLRPKE